MYRLCALFIAMVGLSMIANAAQVHQWRDKDGKIYFGDRPPPNVQSTQVTVKPNVYSSPSIENLSKLLTPSNKVVLYSTTWCGYCKQARKYFQAQGIAYTDYDVETTEKGKRDYARMGAHGVPIILVGGKRLNGFSEESFQSLYRPQ
jgi:glutaredoxin